MILWVSVIFTNKNQYPFIINMAFAYFPDPPKDNGGSEILKYLLEITDGNSEGKVFGNAFYSNPKQALFSNMRNICVVIVGKHSF